MLPFDTPVLSLADVPMETRVSWDTVDHPRAGANREITPLRSHRPNAGLRKMAGIAESN